MYLNISPAENDQEQMFVNLCTRWNLCAIIRVDLLYEIHTVLSGITL